MRREVVRFIGEAERLKRTVNIGGELRKARRSFNPAPHNPWMEFVGEKSDAAKIRFDGLAGMYRGEGCADGIELSFVRLAQKFQRDVHSFGADPASTVVF